MQRLRTRLRNGGSLLPSADVYLNFLSGALDSRITFTRSTTATFTGSNGLIQTAAINEPRFDYDPVTLAAKGLLIEEQRTNLATYSEQFDNAAWTKTAATVTANATASPDGTADADLLVPTTTLAQHRLDYTSTSTAATHAFSAYAKSGGYGFVWLRIGTSGGVVSLTDGTVSSVSGGYTVTATNAGGGWWRVVVVGSAALNSIVRINALPTSSVADFAGNGTSGIFIWGAQLEAGAFATSYIPTVASQVTRTADVASIVAPNFAPWYNQSEGTFVGAFDAISPASTSTWVGISDGTSTNRMQSGSSSGSSLFVVAGGVTQAAISSSAVTANAVTLRAIAYQVDGFAVCTAGGSVGVDTLGSVPTVDRVTIGGLNSSSQINGHIRSIQYYNTRLPNATLQALTA